MSSPDRGVARAAAALASGLLFGLGLAVSGMTNPDKVRNFLDVTGAWDPSLLLVMGGAVAVAFVGFRFARRRARPRLDIAFHVSARRDVDAPLAAGAFVFGIGWGLGGFCPGPAVAALAYGSRDAAIFVLAMLAGLALVQAFKPPRASTRPAPR